MEDINEFWNNYWHKPKKAMANEFGHNESNKELALKFAKAYANHKLKSLDISVVNGQLLCDTCKTNEAIYSTNIGKYCRSCKPF